jgi:uncharacterized damage-inducible protein DinB
MNPQIRSVADMYAFNTLTLRVGLGDVSDDLANRRWRSGDGSSIGFLVGHLLSSRYGLLKRFGETAENPYAELFGASAQPRDEAEYPPVAELAAAWDEVASRLERTIGNLSDEDIEAPAEGFPVADQTVRGALMFMAWHESYHVGQIGLMRTEMGLPSVQARLYESMRS